MDKIPVAPPQPAEVRPLSKVSIPLIRPTPTPLFMPKAMKLSARRAMAPMSKTKVW